jgi:hypothetical protein
MTANCNCTASPWTEHPRCGPLPLDFDPVQCEGLLELAEGVADHQIEVYALVGGFHIAEENLHFLNGGHDCLGLRDQRSQGRFPCLAGAGGEAGLEEDAAERLVDLVRDGGSFEAGFQFARGVF